MISLLAFMIGFFGGLRSLTAPAATAWAAHLGWLKLERPLPLIGSLPSVGIFTVIALAELVADKLPQTPRRTAPGGLTGACLAAAGARSIFVGALFRAVGGVVGAFLATRPAPD
ncbi:MAG TPA: hypothetical protein VMT22_24945 [Terriglobales bacterium]|jgi:uncharacterized membrane protein|nr:hypothetical protein [Terriglobales bacterium]